MSPRQINSIKVQSVTFCQNSDKLIGTFTIKPAMIFLPPRPIDYAEQVIQGSQDGYAGWNNQHNIQLVSGAESNSHLVPALTTRPWLHT